MQIAADRTWVGEGGDDLHTTETINIVLSTSFFQSLGIGVKSDAQFLERLAWPISVDGEGDFPDVFADPFPAVVDVLRSFETWDGVREHLPDLPLNH